MTEPVVPTESARIPLLGSNGKFPPDYFPDGGGATLPDRLSESSLNATYVRGVGRLVSVPLGGTVPTLEEGDLLIRYNTVEPGTNYYTDFSTATLNQQPAGFSDALWADLGWLVETDATATGGRSVHLAQAANGRSLLVWDQTLTDPDVAAGVEVLFKWRADVGFAPGVAFRAGGATGVETGYRLGVSSNTEERISRYDAPTAAVLDNKPFTSPAKTVWCMTRARISGSTMMSKSWLATDPEPAWQVQATDVKYTSGPFGIMSSNLNHKYIDWVAIATGGRTAVQE